MTIGDLIKICSLDNIDTLSLLVAGACHDYGNDGFTNEFHKNTLSERSIEYDHLNVQQNWAAA